MNPNFHTDERFNSYLQFIRPTSRPNNTNNNTNKDKRSTGLHISTDPLGISYNDNHSPAPNQKDDAYYADIFKRLNFPHDRQTTGKASSSSGGSRYPLSSSMPQQQPLQMQHRTSLNQHHEEHRRTSTTEPALSQSPSPSSSSSCASPVLSPFPRTREIPRSKCQVIRRRGSSMSSSSCVSAKSWDHIKSPAASFLASFASPTAATSGVAPLALHEEEDAGDEIDDYVLEKIIGYGGFSTVRSGYCISDGHKVAVKVIKKSCMSDADLQRLERELDLWKSLDHEHLVTIEKLLETDHAMYVVCSYCSAGSLHDWMKRKQSVTENEARVVVQQLCSALQYLHEEARVCHKDVKLENVLLDEHNRVRLCDFGLSVYIQPVTTPPPTPMGIQSPPSSSSTPNELDEAGGSLAYVAPEQVRSRYMLPCPKTDMWSLGVLLYAMVVGKCPFEDDYDARLQQKILNGTFHMPDFLSNELQALLRNLLHQDPKTRYTARQVLQSDWCGGASAY
ncbi:protein sad-isoform b [Lichtheimia corymbifera JMRC:FSU:9682]|uniref:Protein sad-isoform b n=2 Tax=Lichtheimia corymbifera JMRC:FSU:9682 TaxID=1263082 RepID=A0A068S4L4_9FUNG|nr:protein sad-isoform b [Lichtheimia corymbifera JMRC:FSU:9682]